MSKREGERYWEKAQHSKFKVMSKREGENSGKKPGKSTTHVNI